MFFHFRMRTEVFPAHAGVILLGSFWNGYVVGFPRTRGGDPALDKSELVGIVFSPHTRG